jgi:hypothetical protein
MAAPSRKQHAHMTRLLKPREGETKRPAAGHRLTMKMWMAMCREHEPVRSKLLQVKDRGTE